MPSDLTTVAWLQAHVADDGTPLLLGLFETTPAGVPIRFRFGTVPRGVRDAVASWLPSDASPTLLVVADNVFGDSGAGLVPAVPVYRVAVSAGVAGRTGWVAGRTVRAERTLQAIGATTYAFEPLVRTGLALETALQDRRVREMAALRGLAMTVTLSLVVEGEESVASGDIAEPDALALRLRQILELSPAASTAVAGEMPLDWPHELMPFQHDGVRALLNMDRLLLADDMGLGKTVQAVAALRILKARGTLRRALVVAPTSVLDQWRREIARWAPELTAIVIRGSAADRGWQWRAGTDIAFASYGVLRADGWRPEVGGRAWDVVVADEAQRIKNRVDTSNAVKSLRRQRSWALTGTPIENREEELASIMEFVDHDGSLPLKRYFPGEALFARHRELQLRRRKQDVLGDLPPKLVSKVTIDLEGAQRESYDRAERDGIVYLQSLGTDVSIVHVLELITRLKQICNADPKTGASSKLDDITTRIRELSAQGHKALVFSQYTNATSGTAAIAKHLAPFNPLTLTGATPIPERPALIEAFRTEPTRRALILSLRAAGLGLNLQEASYVFHLDRWWNPAVERQAEDRTHRIGQTVKVHVVKYACRDTIEERIDEILAKKQALFDELVDDVSLDLSARLSRDDLLGLFGL